MLDRIARARALVEQIVTDPRVEALWQAWADESAADMVTPAVVTAVAAVVGERVESPSVAVSATVAALSALSHPRPRWGMPPAEAQLWRSVGARPATVSESARVVARSAALIAQLVAASIEGDAAMAEVLGVDRSRVSQRVADRSLYCFDGPNGRLFPRWQLVGRKPLPGLREVLGVLRPTLHPLTVDHWMTTVNVDLIVDEEPVSPVEWLASGGPGKVVAALAEEL